MSETEFDIYFAGIDWGETFNLFPKVEITYDPEYQELTKNEDYTNLFFFFIRLHYVVRLWNLPEPRRINN